MVRKLIDITGAAHLDGPSPMFVIDASTRGSGKSLAAMSSPSSSRAPMLDCYTRDDKEISKFITSVAMAGDQLYFGTMLGPVWESASMRGGNIGSLEGA